MHPMDLWAQIVELRMINLTGVSLGFNRRLAGAYNLGEAVRLLKGIGTLVSSLNCKRADVFRRIWG